MKLILGASKTKGFRPMRGLCDASNISLTVVAARLPPDYERRVVLLLSAGNLLHVLTLRPHVVSTPIDNGAVLLDLESKFFYRANSSAWAILQLLESGATIEEIVVECRRWGAPAESEDGIKQLVARLVGENLVSSSPASERHEPASVADAGGSWTPPVIERQAEPLHRVISSAFDPSIPLAE